MKPKILSLTLLMLVCMAMIPVQAQTITMANPGNIAERDIIVYWPNGTMFGFYNTTSVISLDNHSDYIFTMKPHKVNLFDDPRDALQQGYDYVSTNWIYLVIIVSLIAMLVFRRS